MRSILIAESSEELRVQLATAFKKEYTVYECSDGEKVPDMLHLHKPDVLILSLMLPGMDGITILERTGAVRPPVILCLTRLVPTDYITQTIMDLGVGYIMRKPCRVEWIVERVKDMLDKSDAAQLAGPQSVIGTHLKRLHLPQHRKGFRRLQIGIPSTPKIKTSNLPKNCIPQSHAYAAVPQAPSRVPSAICLKTHGRIVTLPSGPSIFPTTQNAPALLISSFAYLNT